MPFERRGRPPLQARVQVRHPPPHAGSHRWLRAGGADPAGGHPAPVAPGAPPAPTAPRRPPGRAAPHPPQTEPEAARRPAGQPHPARPQRHTAEHPRHRPTPAPPFPSPPRRHVDNRTYSLKSRTDEAPRTPSARLSTSPSAATPTDRAVEPELATDGLDLRVHAWRMPHDRRRLRRWPARELPAVWQADPTRRVRSASR